MHTAQILTIGLALFATGARAADEFPEIRVVLQEAEKLAADQQIQFLPDRSKVRTLLVDAYAAAGYFDDAERLAGSDSWSLSSQLWRVHLFRGNLDTVGRHFASIADARQRTQAQHQMALVLWQLLRRDDARQAYAAALRSASSIADVVARKRLTSVIESDLARINEEPPFRLSIAHRRERPRAGVGMFNPNIPPFPISTDTFRQLTPEQRSARSAQDTATMTVLYERMAAGDRQGLDRLLAQAKSPWGQTLILASIEHLLIQLGGAGEAEATARQMPESDADCILAKAEALAAAGATWYRATGDKTKAALAFTAASETAAKARELALGQITVLMEIAKWEAQTGLRGALDLPFGEARKIAATMPLPASMAPPAGSRVKVAPRNYRNEAYPRLLETAIEVELIDVAEAISSDWYRDVPRDAWHIATDWQSAGRFEEAVAFSRRITDVKERLSSLLSVCRYALKDAGSTLY